MENKIATPAGALRLVDNGRNKTENDLCSALSSQHRNGEKKSRGENRRERKKKHNQSRSWGCECLIMNRTCVHLDIARGL